MRSRRKHRYRTGLIAVVAVVVLAALAAGTFLVKRYAPSKEWMDGYKYFEVDSNTDKTLVIIDNKSYSDIGVMRDDVLYLPVDFVADYINVRFYYDKESNAVLYTDDRRTYTYEPDSTVYKDSDGNTYDSEYKRACEIDGTMYIAFQYVADYTNCTYAYGSKPSRLSVNMINGEVSRVTAKKDMYIRYRGGVKSDILEQINKGDSVYYVESFDDWIKVISATGYTGYVKSSDVSEVYTEVPDNTYESEYAGLSISQKVKLGWFQVAGTAGNDNYTQLTGLSNINVIAPTWYSITSENGSMSNYSSASWVNAMHNRGLQVWPLVDDFNKSVDFKALYSSRTARKTMIDTLIKDARAYGYDGINLDLENVKSDYAKDFLQFVRELSVECHKNNIILSTDNYKPEAYNSCYNLKEQSDYVDYAIVMAYDEHYAGSEAGSVASLPFVKEAVEDMTALVPADKVVVGIPFFTRIWSVSQTSTTSSAVGMQAAIDELNKDGQTAIWNDDAGQYVCSYDKNGVIRKIWFEEDKSIEEKLKVVVDNNTAGIAVWKLGLEKASVWNVINQYIND
mgnify:FL=1